MTNSNKAHNSVRIKKHLLYNMYLLVIAIISEIINGVMTTSDNVTTYKKSYVSA
jgi:hypothetical protein